jgi:four helix bundle protein
MLSFQKLDVYQCSVAFAALAVEVATSIPRGHGALSDQLRRAAFSVPLNVAEAAGRASEADAARHYAIARGSAMECAAVLDVVRCLGVLVEDRYQHGMELLARTVANAHQTLPVTVVAVAVDDDVNDHVNDHDNGTPESGSPI